MCGRMLMLEVGNIGANIDKCSAVNSLENVVALGSQLHIRQRTIRCFDRRVYCRTVFSSVRNGLRNRRPSP